MLVVVDVGNTTVAFGAFEGDRLVATERVEAGRELIGDVIPFPFLQAADRVVVACSSPGRLDSVLAALARPARVLGPADVVRHTRSYGRPDTLGIDRVAVLLGARATCGPGPVVLADVGTCVTVDALTGDDEFVPIAIAPGLPAALAGLRSVAPHLPPPPVLPGPVRLPARGTEDSLRAGFLLGLAGLVDRLLDEAAQRVDGSPRRVLTGGTAATLVAHLRTPPELSADALLHGLRVLADEVGAA